MRQFAAIAMVLIMVMSLAPVACHGCCAMQRGQTNACCAAATGTLHGPCGARACALALRKDEARALFGSQAVLATSRVVTLETVLTFSATGAAFPASPERPRPPGVLRI